MKITNRTKTAEEMVEEKERARRDRQAFEEVNARFGRCFGKAIRTMVRRLEDSDRCKNAEPDGTSKEQK